MEKCLIPVQGKYKISLKCPVVLESKERFKKRMEGLGKNIGPN